MKLIGKHNLETKYGPFALYGFEQSDPSEIIVALKRNDSETKGNWLVRIQYGCLTGTAFHSIDCDCARQLDYSIRQISKAGRGLILYFPKREANGAGLAAKIRMNAKEMKSEKALREAATGMVKPSTEVKKLKIVRKVLRALEIRGPIRLLSNSPAKVAALRKAGVEIESVVHLKIREDDLSPFGKRELNVKRSLLGHWMP